MKTFGDLNTIYATAKSEMNNTMNNEMKNLKRVMKLFNNRLDTMENIADDLTACIKDVKNILSRSPGLVNVSSIISKANYEKHFVYGKILNEIYNNGRKRLEYIGDKIMKFGVENDCETNETCLNVIVKKTEELPKLYLAEFHTTKALLLQHEYNFKTRMHSYTNELKRNLKPYLYLAEYCLHKHVSVAI